MQICFGFKKGPSDDSIATITIYAATVTNAEQDIVILDADGKAIAIVQMQPGYDRFQIEVSE